MNIFLLLQQYPKLGKQTDNKPVRVIIIREFKIFYVLMKLRFTLLDFGIQRQDPERFCGCNLPCSLKLL